MPHQVPGDDREDKGHDKLTDLEGLDRARLAHRAIYGLSTHATACQHIGGDGTTAAFSAAKGRRRNQASTTGARMKVVESYVERPPLPRLAKVVRTVWIQRTGPAAYVQRHLPTGGVEIHFPIGGQPQLVGPLTGPAIEVIRPHTTIVGVRFQPGTAPVLPTTLDDLVDQRLNLAELWGASAGLLAEAAAQAGTPERALMLLQAHLVREFRTAVRADPLVGAAVQALMPWHPVNIRTLAGRLAVSASQLRRRCLHAVGVSPKALQRTLRFQGFLALAQAGALASGKRDANGMTGLAVDAGYADQAHLSRECVRLTGLTPGQLLGGSIDRCCCGHDHAASYEAFLATRHRPPPSA
jgi:AraC-like DNA-binding protein